MDILLPALILAGVGFVMGLLIYLIGKAFYVEEDPGIEEIVEILPRYNCGACGYPGCKEMAIAMLKMQAVPTQCKPMKKENEEALKAYLAEYFAKKKQQESES